jgi:hypothetical protein
MAIDFFKTTPEIRVFVKGIDSGTLFDTFDAPFRPAKQRLINLIGQTTYDQILAYYTTPTDPVDAKLASAVDYIRGALANILAYSDFIFNAPNRNNTDNNIYRYQEDSIIQQYIENAYSELGFLIAVLESDTTKFSAFAGTDTYKLRQDLFLKSAAEFQRYYNIDTSAYFFQNIVYIIEEVQKEHAFSRYADFPDMKPDGSNTNEILKWNFGKAIAFETVARACMRLDYTELPKGIRNSIIKEIGASVNRTEMGSVKEKMYILLHEQAKQYWLAVETEANKIANDGDIILPDEINDEDNKFFLMH